MKRYKTINKILFYFSMIVYSLATYASDTAARKGIATRLLIPPASKSGSTSVGGFNPAINEAFSFGMGLYKIIKVGAILGGLVCLLLSIRLYIKHRQSPVEIPLSTVFILFFAGLLLIALSFIPLQA